MKKVLENDLCIVDYSETLQSLAESTMELLKGKIPEYEEFFCVKLTDKIKVNYFDNLQEFRDFIHNIRNDNSLPEYATGTYDKDMINACINPEDQNRRVFTASHELFHILYKKYILEKNNFDRIVWYDEGMAQYMSGEKDKIKDEESFKQFYLKVKADTKIIPELGSLIHGKMFLNDNYNGYNLSYIAIRYLNEILNPDEFKNLMYNPEKIKEYGKRIVINSFNYFDKRYCQNDQFEEEIEYLERLNYDNDYLYLKGKNKILFSAPHTMMQEREDGSIKLSEPYTKAISLFLNRHDDTYSMVKLKDTKIESNNDNYDDYNVELRRQIKENDIAIIIDLHGAAKERDFDVEFGTLNNLSTDYITVKELEDSFRENGINNIAYNDPFKGGAITKGLFEIDNVDVIQIEINKKYREDPESLRKIISSLETFIKKYNESINKKTIRR